MMRESETRGGWRSSTMVAKKMGHLAQIPLHLLPTVLPRDKRATPEMR